MLYLGDGRVDGIMDLGILLGNHKIQSKDLLKLIV